MGAINTLTNLYEYPKIAIKGKNKYKCPCCEKYIILKNGKIKRPHFAHYKSTNPCLYYNKPSETQIHKDAKLLMKTLLDNKNHIIIYKKCNYCGYIENNYHNICDNYDDENTETIIEYKFYYNNSNRSADVALLKNNKIKYIFEICYKNKTKEENRPEPWIEINAEFLINKINSGEIINEHGIITIECIRNYKCNLCIKSKEQINNYLMQKKEKEDQIKKEKEDQEKEYRIKQEKYRIKQEKYRIKKEKEDQIRNEKENYLNQLCKCGIMNRNICSCVNPTYELIKLSNNLFCINCNKWKCRCK
jgi:hypothetical protein